MENETKQIRKAVKQIWFNGDIRLNETVGSVVEISRITALPARIVLSSVANNNITLTDGDGQNLRVTIRGKSAQNPREVVDSVITPRGSKKRDQFKSKIWSEGQRYQRRFHLQSRNEKGKPTSKRINALTTINQIERAKVSLIPSPVPKTERQLERENIKEGLSKRWETQYTNDGRNVGVNRKTKENTTRRANSFMSFVSTASVVPPQRPGKIKELVSQAVSDMGEVIFVNWICPPGTPLKFDVSTRKLYRLYSGVDNKLGFENDYRLCPRIDLEKRLIKQLNRVGPKAVYIKSVADDNPFCLYPACLRLDGEKATLLGIDEYSKYVQGRLDQLVGKDNIWVMRWSELLGPELFQEMLDRFDATKFEDLESYLPANILETEMDVLSKHTSPDPSLIPAFRQFAKDVIVQYNVEMDILYEAFGDIVVLVWNESTRRGAMLDALRKSKGRPPIPKMYVLHRKRNEEIINNF